eukprot:COSAG02_NODE_4086_length_5806_cov_8.073243_7_plen_553_part_00
MALADVGAKKRGATRRRERQMADVLWRKVQEGPRPAWNYLGRVARKGSANAHHCSIMLRICDSAEDLHRLEEYIADQGVVVDEILLHQLHRAWLNAGHAGSAVRCLMAFTTNRAEVAVATNAALQSLLRCKDTAGATDYLSGLVEAAAAEPHHLWQILHVLCPDREAKRRYLLDNDQKLNPTCRNDSIVNVSNSTIEQEWVSSWLAALHAALVSADAALKATEMFSRAVEIGLLSAEVAHQQSIKQIRKMQGHTANDSKRLGTAAYLAALHQSGLATAEHFAAALTSAHTLQEGRQILEQLQSLPIVPDRNVVEAFHGLLVHEQIETVDPLDVKYGTTTRRSSENIGNVTAEAARWLSRCVERGYIELDVAAAAAARYLSSGQQNQLSEQANAWRYFDALVASNTGLGNSMLVLSAMARGHCVSECDAEALTSRVCASSITSAIPTGQERLRDVGSVCNSRVDNRLRCHKAFVPSPHAMLHDAWLGVGPKGVDRAVTALSDAIHTGSCTQEEAGRIATATLGRCRGINNKAPGMLAIAREDYFAKLQQVRKS